MLFDDINMVVMWYMILSVGMGVGIAAVCIIGEVYYHRQIKGRPYENQTGHYRD